MLLFKFWKIHLISKKLYKHKALDKKSAVLPANLSLHVPLKKSLQRKIQQAMFIHFTDKGALYLEQDSYLLFRKKFNERLFLLIFNVTVIIVLLVMLGGAWILNSWYFG